MKLDFRYLVRAGLLAGFVTFFIALVGMTEAFHKREVVADLFTLGQLMLVVAPFVAAIVVGQKLKAGGAKTPSLMASGLILGAIAAVLPVVFVFLPSVFENIRDMFVSFSPKLLKMMTFDQETQAAGLLRLVGITFAASAAGTFLVLLPKRTRDVLIKTIYLTLGVGIMSELLKQIFQQFEGYGWMSRDTIRLLLDSGSLRLTFAAGIFAAILMGLTLQALLGKDKVAQNKTATAATGNSRVKSFVLLVLLLILPWLVGRFLSDVMVTIGLYVIMGLGLNIAVGQAGLLDLGYLTNFAVGAYVTAVLTSTGPLGLGAEGEAMFNYWILVPISMMVAMFTGLFFSLPVLRMRGDYLAIATLGFGEIIGKFAISDWLKGYIGGAQGILFIPKPTLSIGGFVATLLAFAGAGLGLFFGWRLLEKPTMQKRLEGMSASLQTAVSGGLLLAMGAVLGGLVWLLAGKLIIGNIGGGLGESLSRLWEFKDPQQLYYVVLAACLLMLFISVRLNNSRTGRQWMALREDEDAAAAMGIDTTRTKVIAFTLSAAAGGLAGSIFASRVGSVFPNSFTIIVSINVLSLIIVGGLGSVPGIVVGAAALVGLPELLREFSEFRFLIYGALLVTMMLVRPEGLWPSAAKKRELRADDAVAVGGD